MDIAFAPLEGITTYIYRRSHAKFFGGCGRYFAPFMVACQKSGFKAHEIKGLLPENNDGLVLIPQLLGNDAESFVFASRQIAELGYGEININLGCPSGTVVSKRRGSGLLAYPEELERFLEGVFAGVKVKISVKTRLGLENPEEFYKILEIYNKFPIEELIIHPRVRRDMYKNTPNLEMFGHAVQQSANPLCYNGDIFTVSDFEGICAKFSRLDSLMLGRGAVANPALPRMINGGKVLELEEFKAFHDEIYENYRAEYSGDRNVMHRMKELWFYMGSLFAQSRRQIKRINKCLYCSDYDGAVAAIYRECEFLGGGGFQTP